MSETISPARSKRLVVLDEGLGCVSSLRTGAGQSGQAGDQEAGLLTCRPRQEPSLLAEGWQPRFVADRRMVSDATSTYVELGFEVTTLPLDEDGVAESCAGCAVLAGQFCVVYTRRV